jgi:serine/threonine protein kinase
MQMSPDNWDRAKELFDAALELDPPRRASFLAENCRDEALRLHVEKLLINYQEAGSFLDDPVLNPSISPPNAPAEIETEGAARPRQQSAELLTTDTSAEAEDPMVGRQLGAYKIVRRIGQGGMGAVFLAVRSDDEYRKQVAIKLVPPGLDSGELLSRFRNERQTLAGLDHPNIVKLLDGGSTPEGVPFLVMDYVEGSLIDEYCDQHKLSIDERLHLFCKVCDAVQYAHHELVVHRDLKPSNILVTADGIPKLLDFGIAKVLNPNPSAPSLLRTYTGTRCMTPAYASPEQMRGKSVTPATDVYSLGVVLYELLTGHRPYRLTQHTPAEIERAICEQEPETPSTVICRVETDTSSEGRPITTTPESVSQTREGQPDKLRRRLRGDLDNIVLKALQKEPQRRYDSVEEFSQDIGRHLQHLPVKARPSTLGYRTSKYVQRHKIEVSAVSAIVLVVIASVSFVFNVLGLRDRILGVGPGSHTRLQALNAGQAFNLRGRVTAGGAGTQPAMSCESLIDIKLPQTTITLTRSVPAGSFTPPGSDPIQNLPGFCQIEGVIKPATDSDIRFEVWMPDSGWNGKFRAVGNNGFGGSINYDDMAPAVRNGYATASTDTGHVSDERDAGWALAHPEKVADLGYRAVHEMTEKSKVVIGTFYGKAPQWSFFEGCSNGGREALMEAQRFPEDFQGILAGAPAIPATRLLAAGLYNIPTSSPTYIPASKLPAISAAVLAACDAQDGVVDGILNDPRQCHFDPSVLLCRAADTEGCLTAAQVVQVKKIYSGLRTSDGKQLYPGYLPGSEEGDQGWALWLTGAAPGQGLISIYGINYFRNMVFDNPTWDYRTSTAQKAAAIADVKTAPIVDAIDPDLRRFEAHSGKLILYHGWSDAGMSALATTGYYDGIAAALGARKTENFVRLYMAPGMHHCYGGVGPNYFGQLDLSSLGSKTQQLSANVDPQHNIFSALERWVEKGVAPGPIIATKYVNDLDPSQGIKMTRPLCPYPQIAKYNGAGDTNDATNFVCTNNE